MRRADLSLVVNKWNLRFLGKNQKVCISTQKGSDKGNQGIASL